MKIIIRDVRHAERIRLRLPDTEPAIILAPQFEWVDTMPAEGGYTWRELVPSPQQHSPTRH